MCEVREGHQLEELLAFLMEGFGDNTKMLNSTRTRIIWASEKLPVTGFEYLGSKTGQRLADIL